MKYVIFEHEKTKWLSAVIFPDDLTHSQVRAEGARPISAGFVDPGSGDVFGKSESLGLHSNPNDHPFLVATLTNNQALLITLNSAPEYKH